MPFCDCAHPVSVSADQPLPLTAMYSYLHHTCLCKDQSFVGPLNSSLQLSLCTRIEQVELGLHMHTLVRTCL
jgi:hypothetical protein